ncbi:MAG: hypothetical protein H7837_07635 [Magnetococcus sp. MYC-9]
MKDEPTDTPDPKRLENLPALTTTEAAWMAGVTAESFARFLEAAGLHPSRALSVTELIRAGFAQLGQREAQLAMFRLQLASALQREKELTELLHAKLTATVLDSTAPLTMGFPSAGTQPTTPQPSMRPVSPAAPRKIPKRGNKKK